MAVLETLVMCHACPHAWAAMCTAAVLSVRLLVQAPYASAHSCRSEQAVNGTLPVLSLRRVFC